MNRNYRFFRNLIPFFQSKEVYYLRREISFFFRLKPDRYNNARICAYIMEINGGKPSGKNGFAPEIYGLPNTPHGIYFGGAMQAA